VLTNIAAKAGFRLLENCSDNKSGNLMLVFEKAEADTIQQPEDNSWIVEQTLKKNADRNWGKYLISAPAWNTLINKIANGAVEKKVSKNIAKPKLMLDYLYADT
jgi:hypothetical protein